MAIPKLYSSNSMPPVASRDPNGIYFVKTATGYTLLRVADTAGKELIPMDIPTPSLQAVNAVNNRTTIPIAKVTALAGANGQFITAAAQRQFFNPTGVITISHALQQNTTFRVRIHMYSYSLAFAATYDVVFLRQTSTTTIYMPRAIITSNITPPSELVRVSHLGTDVVVMIGDVGTSWGTSVMDVSIDVSTNWTNGHVNALSDGWALGSTTDISGYSTLYTAVTQLMATRNWVEVQGYLTTANLSSGSNGQILNSAGTGVTLNSLGSANNSDADTFLGQGLSVTTNTTGSTNYPSAQGSGLRIHRNTSGFLGAFELWKSNTSGEDLYFRTGTGSSTFSAWKRIADKDWVQAQGYLTSEVDPKRISTLSVTGTTTKTITATLADGSTVDAIFTDENTTYTDSASVTLTGSSFQRAALTGDVTAPLNSNATVIANNAVNNAKMADMAADTIKGRITSAGDPQDLTPAQVNGMLGIIDRFTNNSFPVNYARLTSHPGMEVGGLSSPAQILISLGTVGAPVSIQDTATIVMRTNSSTAAKAYIAMPSPASWNGRILMIVNCGVALGQEIELGAFNIKINDGVYRSNIEFNKTAIIIAADGEWHMISYTNRL